MTQQELYRETFSALRPSEARVQEVMDMTNSKTRRRRLGRRTLGALAACAALCLMVVGANAATGGAVMEWVLSVVEMEDPFRAGATLEDGSGVDIILQRAWVEDRDGRAILVMPGEEVDITQALETDGVYHYQGTAEGWTLRAQVTGTAEDWTITLEAEDGSGQREQYTFTAHPEEG